MTPRSVRTARRVRSAAIAIFGCATVWAAVGQAQGQGQPSPPRILAQMIQVKPEMLEAYQELIKSEGNPALKKAGVPFRWMFANASGPGFTFISVQPLANFAQLDQSPAIQRALGAEGAAKDVAKLRPMMASTHTYVQTLALNMSIMSNAATPPPFGAIQIFQTLPGKGAEFASLMASDYLPAYKKAGVKDFWVYNTNFGGPAGQILTFRPLTKYADLDQPGLLAQAGMSQEAIQLLNNRRIALVSGAENQLVRLVPDLTFGMPSPPPTR